jgi:ABC-2 type transport system ATP-binding protein
MDDAIHVRELKKAYGDVQALDGFSLSVEQGEFFGLLGPNGAGKTTFINTLVGLARADSGTATVFGYDIREEFRQVRNLIGLAPQEYNVDRFSPSRRCSNTRPGITATTAPLHANARSEPSKQSASQRNGTPDFTSSLAA